MRRCPKHAWKSLYRSPRDPADALQWSIFEYDRYVVCCVCDRIGWRSESRRAIVTIDRASEPVRRKNAEERNTRHT
jgi:hypothetical protein